MTLNQKFLLSALCGISFAASASAKTVFIDNVKTSADQSVDILVEDGIIVQIGAELEAPSGAAVFSGDDQWASPGLFASLTNLGMVEIGAESSTNDTGAEDAKTSVSNMDVYGFNPNSPIIDNTRVSGVTHAVITGRPTQNIFSGTGFIANMTGNLDSVENEKAFIYVQLGSRGGKLAGGSRSAALSQFQNAVSDARNYSARFGGPDDGDALHRRDAAALQDAARGRMPIIVGADRASDLLQIIDLKKELHLNIIIAGAAEGWLVADELAAANMRVIVDPVANLPGSFDVVGSRIDNAKLMSAAGVELALMSFSESTSHNVRVLNQHAGNAVANGLGWDQAMEAITTTPASWFGVNIGGIAKGSDTFVVWDGDPLQVTSAPILIVIGGEEQSLMSRQRELRDRYNPTREDTRAHKYR